MFLGGEGVGGVENGSEKIEVEKNWRLNIFFEISVFNDG